jgi:hypothetical protein
MAGVKEGISTILWRDPKNTSLKKWLCTKISREVFLYAVVDFDCNL